MVIKMLVLLLFGIIYSVITVFIINNFPDFIFPMLIFPFILGIFLSVISDKGPLYEKLFLLFMLPFALFVVFA